jgi:hypothetical protein
MIHVSIKLDGHSSDELASPKTTVSALFGVGAALLMVLIGPLYGGLVLILALALVFRSADRVVLAWLFGAFTATWAPLLVAIAMFQGASFDTWLVMTGAGFVPVGLAAGMIVVARARSRT